MERIEYDPNRSANLALVCYADGERRYVIAAKGIKIGDNIISGENAPIKVGNALPLKNIPLGSVVHCVELKVGKGAQLARSAAASVQVVAKEGYTLRFDCEVERCERYQWIVERQLEKWAIMSIH